MSKATLYLIVVGGLIFILLVAGVTVYRIKFKKMEDAWTNEKAQRENLEKSLADTQRQLSATQQQLSAKINEVSILQDALDTLRKRASNLSKKAPITP